MEWIGQAKLQVLWFYTESRQETGEDGDIVLILGNCTDKKKPFKINLKKTPTKLKTFLKEN